MNKIKEFIFIVSMTAIASFVIFCVIFTMMSINREVILNAGMAVAAGGVFSAAAYVINGIFQKMKLESIYWSIAANSILIIIGVPVMYGIMKYDRNNMLIIIAFAEVLMIVFTLLGVRYEKRTLNRKLESAKQARQ